MYQRIIGEFFVIPINKIFIYSGDNPNYMREKDKLKNKIEKVSIKSISDKSVDEIKKELTLKNIKGKKYYYLKTKIDVNLGDYGGNRRKEIYVAPIYVSDEELRNRYCLSRHKLFLELFSFLYKLSKKHFAIKHLKDEEILKLELLRFGYNVMLKEFNKSDLERYEDVVYTKYVHGTTSIEGNTYTLRETDLTLNDGLTVGGKEKREFFEIENYGKLKKIIGSKIKFNVSFVKKLHDVIMDNIDTDSKGEFRKIDVGIRGTEFAPIQGILVEEEMAKLMEWYADNKSVLHPIELCAFFHQKFEEIHPFKDGNGRVGRELMRLILRQHGYPTIFIDKNNREEYLKGLDAGNNEDFRLLIKFIVDNLIDVHDNLIETAREKLNTEMDEMCKNCSIKEECDKTISENEVIQMLRKI